MHRAMVEDEHTFAAASGPDPQATVGGFDAAVTSLVGTAGLAPELAHSSHSWGTMKPEDGRSPVLQQ